MNLADPSAPFFSYVTPEGETVICLIGVPENGLVPYQAFRRDLDTPTHGVWNPQEGTLALHGDDRFTDATAVLLRGRYVVIEKDGSLTIETSGERNLEEGEQLVTPAFLDTIAPGRRHSTFQEWFEDDEDEARVLEMFLTSHDDKLGSPFSTL